MNTPEKTIIPEEKLIHFVLSFMASMRVMLEDITKSIKIDVTKLPEKNKEAIRQWQQSPVKKLFRQNDKQLNEAIHIMKKLVVARYVMELSCRTGINSEEADRKVREILNKEVDRQMQIEIERFWEEQKNKYKQN